MSSDAGAIANGADHTRPRISGRLRVLALTLVLCLAAGILGVLVVSRLQAFPSPHQLPWWILAPLFAAAEVCVVHIQFRREAHSFSLSELPLIFGLFLASPLVLVLSNLGGTAVTLAVHRRQSPLKLAFNLANFTLGTCVTATLFMHFADRAAPLSNRTFIVATLAVLAAAVLQVLGILAAISLSEGHLDSSGVVSTFGFALVGTSVNCGIALIGVWIVWQDPTIIWLLAVPTAGILLAYRLYVSEREKHDQVDFLYESSRRLQDFDELDNAVASLLVQARGVFRSEIAELAFLPNRDRGAVLRTTANADGRVESMVPVAMPDWELGFIARLLKSSPLIIRSNGLDAEGDAYLRHRGLRDVMAVVLRGESGPIGTMLFGNRLGEVTSFDDEDVRLLEMLANQTGSILERGRLQHSLSQLTALQEQLQHQASHDPLTGIANRLLFRSRTEHEMAQPGRFVSVLLIDLDDFKTVNDSLGHAAGDQLLCAVADRIGRCMRPGDVAARLGGDEFAVLVTRVSDIEGATQVAERIMGSLREPFQILGEEILVHASIGVVAAASGPDHSAEELLLNADIAMYSAKSLGKGRWEAFSPAMHEAVRARHRLKADLHAAIDRDEFELVYQPIVDLRDGSIVAAEALLRWAHPTRGEVQPLEFLGLAEETGLIIPIGAWVLAAACAEAQRWQSRGHTPAAIAVNVSARQLQQRGFVAQVAEVLADTGLDARRLILEVTESEIIADLETIGESLTELRSAGVRVAIDDFGTGQSSLSRLRDLPFDVLKIDKSFTAALCGGNDSMGFARAVFSFGASLGLRVIAEGVETADQLPWLEQLRCDWGQGFHFARPLKPSGMRALLERPAQTPSTARPFQVSVGA